MTGTALILGANGRFGRAATHAFAAAGWQVRAATRAGDVQATDSITPVVCDVMKKEDVIAAAQGTDVIVHAVHPLYPEWAQKMPVHTAHVIAAGLSSGATVMIPANVYIFGEDAAEVYNESSAPAPTTRKGALRVTMEASFEAAAADGLRTVVLRGGDYIERAKTGNWFETYIANKAHKGVFTYPGPMDAVHAWAYLPDMARAMVGLAATRDTLPAFSSFGFEGYSLTGEALKTAVAQAVGRPLKSGYFPWPLMRIIGLFVPLVREVIEMRYLWNTPHRIDGGALAQILPDFVPTPLSAAMEDVLAIEAGSEAKQLSNTLRSA